MKSLLSEEDLEKQSDLLFEQQEILRNLIDALVAKVATAKGTTERDESSQAELDYAEWNFYTYLLVKLHGYVPDVKRRELYLFVSTKSLEAITVRCKELGVYEEEKRSN